MTSIALEIVFTYLYVLVDDWYKAEGLQLMRGKVGAKPSFSDSEMLTLMLANDFCDTYQQGISHETFPTI
jgi:hypothetical protein